MFGRSEILVVEGMPDGIAISSSSDGETRNGKRDGT